MCFLGHASEVVKLGSMPKEGDTASFASFGVLNAVQADYARFDNAGLFDRVKLGFLANALKQPVMDTRSNTSITQIFSILYYILVLGYSVYAFVAYANRPITTSFSMQPMDMLPPIRNLSVHITCSHAAWKCTLNATRDSKNSSWKWVAGPSLTNDGALVADMGTTPAVLDHTYTLTLHPTGPGIVLQVPGFTTDCVYGEACAPSLEVSVSETEVRPDAMDFNMSLEPTQRKAVYIAMLVTYNHTASGQSDWWDVGETMGIAGPGTAATYHPFRQDMFYVGKFPTSSATLEIRASPLASVTVVQRPGSILNVLSSIGGAAAILMPLVKVLALAIRAAMGLCCRPRHTAPSDSVPQGPSGHQAHVASSAVLPSDESSGA